MTVYEILGVSCTATDKEIALSYKKLAAKYHPDHGGNPDDMTRLNEAYAKIKTPELRKKYDTENAFSSEFKMWSSVFGKPNVAENFGKKPTDIKKAVNGTDINLTIHIPMEVFCLGYSNLKVMYKKECTCLSCAGTKAKDFVKCNRCGGVGYTTYRRRQSQCKDCKGSGISIVNQCDDCGGTGKHIKDVSYTIPAYKRFTESLVVAGKGNEGVFGGRNGNLNIKFVPMPTEDGNVYWDEGFHRLVSKNNEIHLEDIALGCTVTVKIGYMSRDIEIPPYADLYDIMGTWCGYPILIRVSVIKDDDPLMYESIRKSRKTM